MTELGYAFSSEEHGPNDLVRYGKMAEQAGFTFGLISDHYHPWIPKQGNSPFVWGVLGGLSQATEKLRIGTGVTCPIMRYHPAIVAQASATAAAMLPGRFFLGVGSGELLNEHILGENWPPADVRIEMLEEAIQVIRLLWGGDEVSFYGDYYVVENARLYTLPNQPSPLYMAAVGDTALELAGRTADGLISTAPVENVVQQFRDAGGDGKPTIGQYLVCVAQTKEEARKIAYEWWPNTALPGTLHTALPTPDHFEDAVKLVTEDMVAKQVVIGQDKKEHLDWIHKLIDAGYEQIYIHQIGPDQKIFFEFYEREILPEFKNQ